MSVYVIGDIHGCYRTLRALLERIRFDPGSDELWLVGDLANRGPGALEVMKWVLRNRKSITMVLGNHDLHLVSRHYNLASIEKGDTIEGIFEDPLRNEMIDYLRQAPLIHLQGRTVLVHAGILPGWDIPYAMQLAELLRRKLASQQAKQLLQSFREVRTDAEQDEIIRALHVFTRLRICRGPVTPHFGFSGPPSRAPEHCLPWFEFSEIRHSGYTFVFGHWANLGLYISSGVICLDTGCVYGGKLTAMRLEDGQIFQEANCES